MSSPEGNAGDKNWPKDEFGRHEVISQFWQLSGLIAVLLAGLGLLLHAVFKSKSPREVIAYCAQDQVFAEAIFRDFQKETGIRVRAVFDSEAVKTVGIVNRLRAERAHPQCDVFWGNEEMRARQLEAQGVFRETNGWAAFGFRSRRMVINTNKLSTASAPHFLEDLTNAIWRGKVALAFPQFGTTSTHFHALRQHWGTVRWEIWCHLLAANNPFLVDGNSVVVRTVGRGDAWLGLTDSDDIAAGQEDGLPIEALPLSNESLLIANTVGVIRHGPHAEAAEQLFEYLQRPAVAERLVTAKALEGISPTTISIPTLKVQWDALLMDLDIATVKLNKIFLR